MKSFSLSVLGFFCVVFMSAQEISEDQFIPQLEKKQQELYTFIDQKDKIDLEIKFVSKNIEKLTNEAEKKKEEEKKEKLKGESTDLKNQIVTKCADFSEYQTLLSKHQGVSEETLNKYKVRVCQLYEIEVEEEELDPEKFIIVGDNEPIKASDLLSNDNTKKVLADIFSIDSKTNLGTFEIPGDNSFINFYAKSRASIFLGIFKKKPQKKTKFEESLKIENLYEDKNSYAISVKQLKLKKTDSTTRSDDKPYFIGQVPEGALFKSIQIELREGGIVDTRLILHSIDNKFEFYFEGTAPVSILNYSRKAGKRSFLRYSHYVSLDGQGVYNENALESLLVKYTDVLDYHPNAGSNYVPDDVSYKFPSDEDKEAKETDRRSYQVINNNHLQHVLDIRTYTDLLGLFGDEANGLIQIEGKADFFIHPFNFPRTALYYLKKVSPYVRYSRFDEDTDFVQANTITTNMQLEYLLKDRKLSLLERSNLEMGLDLNLINFRLFKESPLWTSVYFPLSYNVTKVRTDEAVDNNDANYKTLGFGFGVDFEIRRFNNFGLNLGYELKGHSFIGDYSEFSLQEPGYLKTQAVKAEIFYYPGIDKSNSIFVRMKSIRDIGSGGGDSFFQLQVGYRFTLGMGAIKAK